MTLIDLQAVSPLIAWAFCFLGASPDFRGSRDGYSNLAADLRIKPWSWAVVLLDDKDFRSDDEPRRGITC